MTRQDRQPTEPSLEATPTSTSPSSRPADEAAPPPAKHLRRETRSPNARRAPPLVVHDGYRPYPSRATRAEVRQPRHGRETPNDLHDMNPVLMTPRGAAPSGVLPEPAIERRLSLHDGSRPGPRLPRRDRGALWRGLIASLIAAVREDYPALTRFVPRGRLREIVENALTECLLLGHQRSDHSMIRSLRAAIEDGLAAGLVLPVDDHEPPTKH